MKVYSIVLDRETVSAGLANINGEGVICVSPESEIVRLWTELITRRLETRQKSDSDFTAIRAYYHRLCECPEFRSKVENVIEKTDGYLEEAATFRVVADSIVDYVLNQCSKLCSELVSGLFGTALVEGPNLIRCKEVGGKVTVNWEKTAAQVKERITGTRTVVSAGYGRNSDGYVVKIGRAGSDLTATSIAAILGCESVVFCTKKAGIQSIPYMTFEEAAHFCSSDDAPFFPAAMWPAVKYGIRIEVVNVLDKNAPMTVISAEGAASCPNDASASGEYKGDPSQNAPCRSAASLESVSGNDASGSETVRRRKSGENHITGVVADRGLSLLTVYGSGLLGNVGISSDLFRAIADKDVNIRFISQSSSEYSISFAVKQADEEAAVEAVRSLMSEKHLLSLDDVLILDRKVGIVSVCGDRMRNVPGISGKVFTAVGDAGISIIAAAQGGEELSISIVLDSADVDRGLEALKALTVR